jgi:hypothetical protein
VEHVQEGVRLVLATPSRVVVRQIERAGLDKLIGRDFIHVRMHEAVTYCKVSLDNSFITMFVERQNPKVGKGLQRLR